MIEGPGPDHSFPKRPAAEPFAHRLGVGRVMPEADTRPAQLSGSDTIWSAVLAEQNESPFPAPGIGRATSAGEPLSPAQNIVGIEGLHRLSDGNATVGRASTGQSDADEPIDPAFVREQEDRQVSPQAQARRSGGRQSGNTAGPQDPDRRDPDASTGESELSEDAMVVSNVRDPLVTLPPETERAIREEESLAAALQTALDQPRLHTIEEVRVIGQTLNSIEDEELRARVRDSLLGEGDRVLPLVDMREIFGDDYVVEEDGGGGYSVRLAHDNPIDDFSADDSSPLFTDADAAELLDNAAERMRGIKERFLEIQAEARNKKANGDEREEQ